MSINNHLPKFHQEVGDTIVEVMVVLAVLGLAISISYATANRSLLNTRQAQENSQATEYVQSQVEELRTLTLSSSSQNIFQAGPYCLTYDSLTNSYDVQTAAANCVFGGLYNISITYSDNPPLNPKTFTVTASWPDVEGLGNDTVTLTYRLYPQ